MTVDEYKSLTLEQAICKIDEDIKFSDVIHNNSLRGLEEGKIKHGGNLSDFNFDKEIEHQKEIHEAHLIWCEKLKGWLTELQNLKG